MNPDFSHLAVEFYLSSKHNKRKSADEGRPIYDDVEMIKIRIAGDQKTVFHAPAHDQSAVFDQHLGRKMTYAELHVAPYEAFKKGLEFRGTGTPLDKVSFVTPAKIKELQSFHVETVEQLASLDGANLQRLGMGARELKNKAEAYLGSASKNADITRLQAQNEQLMKRLEALEGNVVPETPQSLGQTAKSDLAALGEPTPFDDWVKEDVEAWFSDIGGKFDKRWSVETARQEAAKLHAQLVKAA